jgi:hypothetical protein
MNCLNYGLIFTMLERLINMDKFDYYMEFLAMRLDDPQFRLMYGINEFDKWYSDFMEILNQKYGEPAHDND